VGQPAADGPRSHVRRPRRCRALRESAQLMGRLCRAKRGAAPRSGSRSGAAPEPVVDSERLSIIVLTRSPLLSAINGLAGFRSGSYQDPPSLVPGSRRHLWRKDEVVPGGPVIERRPRLSKPAPAVRAPAWDAHALIWPRWAKGPKADLRQLGMPLFRLPVPGRPNASVTKATELPALGQLYRA
jgi:hypothetical protein